MKRSRSIAALFYAAAVYDAILGLAFALAAPAIFDALGVARPNHLGYVQFPGLLLLVFAAMFLAIARDPHARRGLIPYGVMLKVSYCLIVFGHWIVHGVPDMWKPLAFLDAAFGILFVGAYVRLRQQRHTTADTAA